MLGASIFLSNTSALVFGTLPKALPPFSGEQPLRMWGVTVVPQKHSGSWEPPFCFSLSSFSFFPPYNVGKSYGGNIHRPFGGRSAGDLTEFHGLLGFWSQCRDRGLRRVPITPLFFTSYNSGTLLGLKGFIAAVLGGWGKNSGAILGGFALGIIESLSVAFIPSGYKDGVAFAILSPILYFRPKGILGSPFIDSCRW